MFMKIVIAILIVSGLALAVRIYMGRPEEDRLRPDEEVVIRALRDPLPGNSFLACPPSYCVATAANVPVFPLPVAALAQRWSQLLAGEPNIAIAANEVSQNRLVVIQHTRLLRFPDIVTVEFIPLGPDKSSLAIYSRARYGSGDFGTNRKRVLAWLGRLDEMVRQ